MAVLETYAAFPGGSVIYVDLNTNAFKKIADVPFANGITTLNSTHIAVASTTLPAVLIYQVEPRTKDLMLTKKLRPNFMVDNLSTDTKGHLLMAGHPSPPTLEHVAKTNRYYDLDGTGRGKPAADRPRAPSWVAEWDGNIEGTIKDLYVGSEYGTSCGAVRDVDRGLGIIVGLYEKGILLWKE
jgi:arylesterase/paraoxonase